MILHALIAMVAGWIQRHQQQVITHLQEENRILKAQLGGRRLRLTDTDRRRLAALAHLIGRTRLQEIAMIATPETLLRWHRRLIAQKFKGSACRPSVGRPRVAEEIESPGGADGRGESHLGLSPHPRGVGKPGTSYRHDHRAEHPAPAPPRACSAAAQDWHELATVSEDPLGRPRRHGLFHSGSSDLAWAGDVLYLGDDGAQHAAGASCGHHPASDCCLHDAVRPATDGFLGWLPPG